MLTYTTGASQGHEYDQVKPLLLFIPLNSMNRIFSRIFKVNQLYSSNSGLFSQNAPIAICASFSSPFKKWCVSRWLPPVENGHHW
jgi:hypothetical protein